MVSIPAFLRPGTAKVMSLVRRGPGTVLWTPEIQMGLGNHLYFWLWAHTRQSYGHPDRVLLRPTMEPWVPHFPAVSPLVVSPTAVKVTDRREIHWNQAFGVDFTREELQHFVRARLIEAPVFRQITWTHPSTLVLNIRRGDYYSNTEFRGKYGFDVDAYLRIAVAEAAGAGATERIHIVSDGLDWCRARLTWLTDYAESVTFQPEGTPPIEQFAVVATAPQLVLTNSTFSYWAGYISNTLHGSESRVWAPRFHARHFGDGSAFQLDPAWHVVQDIPGGWDS